jgi:hypothetical protein
MSTPVAQEQVNMELDGKLSEASVEKPGNNSNSDVQSLDSDWIIADGAMPKLQVDATLERECVWLEANKLAAVLSATAPNADSSFRAPLRLVAVLDKSGSMQGEKLRLVVQTMRFMLRHLSECDALGIVEYDSDVKVIAPLTQCSADGRASLDAALQRVRAGTQTNLSGGLLRGLELHKGAVHKAARSSGLQRVQFGNKYRLLSDEEASHSDTPKNVHEWTMELQFDCPEDAALVQKVTYTLHETFRQPIVEVCDGPYFRLTRPGWGIFAVHATVSLVDGRTIELKHDLVFGDAETFRTLWLPLRILPTPAPSADTTDGLVRSTFLFTDGLANQGITNVEDLCAAAGSMLDELGDRRCVLSTFGFGTDHSADLLRRLAEVGQGNYSFIENEDQIGAAFGEALGGLLSTTHQNTRLCLELSPGVRFARACTEYPVDVQSSEDGSVCVNIELGDLFAEERRDILVELDLSQDMGRPEEEEHSFKLATLSARGFSVLAKRSESAGPMVLSVKRRADASEENPCNPDVERHRCRYLTTEALKSARAAADKGDLDAARQLLKQTLKQLEASSLASVADSLFLGFIADLNDCLNDLRNRDVYTYSGSKKMASYSMAHGKQRAMNCESTEVYMNSHARAMKSAFRANTKSGY